MQKEQMLQQALETKRLLEQLLENKGWQKLVGIVQVQADGLQRDILFTPCSTIDSTIAQEYKKGQLEGRLCLSSLIETEIEVCTSTIDNLRRQLNDDRNDSSTGDRDDTGGSRSAP